MAEMTSEREAEIRQRCERATAGPWFETHNGKLGVAIWGANGRCLFRSEAGVVDSVIGADGRTQWQHDVAFVRRARQDIPALLAALRAERERVDAAEREKEAYKATAAFTKRAWDEFADELRRITGYTGPDDGDVLLDHVETLTREVERLRETLRDVTDGYEELYEERWPEPSLLVAHARALTSPAPEEG